jgi:hypothetical protein
MDIERTTDSLKAIAMDFEQGRLVHSDGEVEPVYMVLAIRARIGEAGRLIEAGRTEDAEAVLREGVEGLASDLACGVILCHIPEMSARMYIADRLPWAGETLPETFPGNGP